MSKESVSICKGLLQKNPEKRLGSGATEEQDIKVNLFYKPLKCCLHIYIYIYI